MLDFNLAEMAVVAVVALLVIGPKDLPKALRVAGYWVGKVRGVARQFRTGFDDMVREAELAEMEKKWQAENERIMREHPLIAPVASPEPDPAAQVSAPNSSATPANQPNLDTPEPLMVEKPAIQAAIVPDADRPAGMSATSGVQGALNSQSTAEASGETRDKASS